MHDQSPEVAKEKGSAIWKRHVSSGKGADGAPRFHYSLLKDYRLSLVVLKRLQQK